MPRVFKATNNAITSGVKTFKATDKATGSGAVIVDEKEKQTEFKMPILMEINNGKISFDPLAQAYGWKNEKERDEFKAKHPNEYALMGGYKYQPIPSRNYTSLNDESEKLLSEARENDAYFQKYGVLDFANNHNIDAKKLQNEIDVLEKDIDEAKKSYRYSKNLVLDVEIRKEEANEVQEILNKYDCKSIEELEGLLTIKKQSINFWEQSNNLIEMTAVGDPDSKKYDPEFNKWTNIGKNLKSQNTGGEQLAPHQAINPVEAVRGMYGDYIGNIEGLSKKIALNMADNSMVEIAAILQMTDEQVRLYNYYLGKEFYNEVEKGTANKYLEYLKTQYNTNTANIIQKELKNLPFFQYCYSAHAALQSFEDKMESFGDIFKNDTYKAETATQKANMQIRQDVIERDGIIGQISYDLINTTAHQLPSILVSTVANVFVPGSGAIVGAGLMGLSSASGAYQEALRVGFDENQARFYSLSVGVAEAGLSYAIGGISKLGGKFSGKVISKVIDGIDNGIAKFALEFGGKILSEGIEESTQEILDPIFKALATNTSVEYWGGIDWGAVAYSGLLGMLSAGAFENIPAAAINTIKQNINNKRIYGKDAETLVTIGLLAPEGSQVYELAAKYNERLKNNKSLTGTQLGMLVESFETMPQEIDKSKISAAAELRLIELGERNNTTEIAKTITKKIVGEDINAKESALINESKYGNRVLNEVMPENVVSGEYASEWAKNIGTNWINKNIYNMNLQSTAKGVVDSGNNSNYNDNSVREGVDYDRKEGLHNGDTRGRFESANTQGGISGLQKDVGGLFGIGQENFKRFQRVSAVRNQGNNRGIELSDEQVESLKSTAIKNEDGTPKIVYHFTNNIDFEVFAKGDIGFHFGNESQARQRGQNLKQQGRIISAYLDIKNPIYINTDLMSWRPAHVAIKLYADGLISNKQYLLIREKHVESGYEYDSPAAMELRRILADLGYDGIIYENHYEGDGQSYIAFYPEQVIIIDDGKQSVKTAISEDEVASFIAQNSEVFDLTKPTQKDIARAPSAEETIEEAITGKQITNIQRHIVDLCKKLFPDITVEFVDRIDEKGKINGKFIRSQNKILIKSDLSAVQMYVEVFKHEFMHRLETKQLYSKFFNFCFKKSKAFEQYVRAELKSAGVDYDVVTREGVLEAYTKYKFNQYKNAEGIPKIDRDKFTMENAQEEIIADFFAQILFQGKQYRERIISALQNADGEALIGIGDEISSEAALMELQEKEPALLEQVIEWFKDIINKLRGMPQANSVVSDLEKELDYLESMVRKAYKSKDSKRLMKKKLADEKYAIVESFTDDSGVRYDNAVLLDTNFFNGLSPRNWGKKLKEFVYNRSANNSIIMPIIDEKGSVQQLQFANPGDRVTKNGASNHKVIDKLSSSSDNISKLSVLHIDEIVEVSQEDNPYYTNEHNHQWLDENGWLHRTAYVINAQNGNIYNITIDIAKTVDGRTILYATDGKIKKVGNVQVNSLDFRGSGLNSNSDKSLSQPEVDVKIKDIFGFKINENADVNKDLLEEVSYYHTDAEVDEQGNITVYHRTTKENADKIKQTGIMTAKEDALFFSSKESGYASDYGDTVVKIKIPSTELRLNDIFDGEVHFDLPLKYKNGVYSFDVSKYLIESNDTPSGQYSLFSPIQNLKYTGAFELSEPNMSGIEVSKETEFLTGLNDEYLNKAQVHIVDIVRKLDSDLTVEFADNLESNGKFIRSQNKILIRSDLSVVQMYIEVFKHEFMHRLETKQLYSKFFNFCFKKSKAFEQYVRAELKSAGVDYDVVTREGVLDAYTKYKYDQYKNSRDIPKADRDSFTVENAQQEIIADFFAEVLFQGEKYRSKLISALENADGEALIGIGDETSSEAALMELQEKEPALLEQVIEWFKDIINKLRGMPQANSVVSDLEKELDYLESMVRKAYKSKDSKQLMKEKRSEKKYLLNKTLTPEDIYANIIKVAKMDNVASLDGSEFEKSNVDLITQVEGYFNSLGNIVQSKYGDIELNRVGIKASLGHGIGRKKAIAFKAIPEVLENGEIIDFQANWKQRGYDTAVFAAPISISGVDYFMAAVIIVETQKNSYYLHEIALQKKENDTSFKTGTVKNGVPGDASFSIYNLLQKLQDVKVNEELLKLAKEKYSLIIKHTDGTIEELADARELTDEQTVEYLNQAKKGVFKWNSYIPVRKDTPATIIETLKAADIVVENRSLVMQVRKAQQAMSANNNGDKSKKHGNNIRSHAISAEQIVEIVNNLDNPMAVILQTNRCNQYGEELPDNVAVFVEYNDSGKEGIAIVEFDSSIDLEFIGKEFGDTNYHTVVTIFEPDTQRGGMPFDYMEELLLNPDNYELEIVRRQPARSAIGKKRPNTSNELPSDFSISKSVENVKQDEIENHNSNQYSLSSPIQNLKYNDEFELSEPNMSGIEVSKETEFLTGLNDEYLNKAQMHIVDIVRKLDPNLTVEFVDKLESNGKFIRSQNKILIRSDLSVVQMYIEVFKHEFIRKNVNSTPKTTSNNANIDKYGYNVDNVSRANNKGELINDYYYALNKSEWKMFYDKITKKGYLATAKVGVVAPIIINNKLIIAERRYTIKEVHDYVVIDAYKLFSPDGDNYTLSLLQDALEKGDVDYDAQRIFSFINRLNRLDGRNELLARYDRNNAQFDAAPANGKQKRSISKIHGDSQEGIAGERLSLRDKSSVQRDNELLDPRIHTFDNYIYTKKTHNNFFNYCFNKSKAFEQYVWAELKLVNSNVDIEGMAREGVLSLYTEYKYNQYKNSKDISQKERDAFTKENAQEEVIADFFAQILFQGKQYRERIISAFQNADGESLIGIGDEISSEAALMELQEKEPTLLEQVVQWVRDIINRLRGMPQAKSLVEQLDNEINYLESLARRAYQSKDSKRLIRQKLAEEKHKVGEIVDQNNISYGIGVILDSDELDDASDDERIKIVKNHIKNLSGKPFLAYDNNGDKVNIIIAPKTKYKSERNNPERANRHLTNFLNDEVKQETLILIDEVINTAKFKNNEPAKHAHGWLDNKGQNDWDIWTTYIQDKNKTIWEAMLKIANSTNGEKILYDIKLEKKVEQGSMLPTSTTNNKITQEIENVNTEKSHDISNDTPSGHYSLGSPLQQIKYGEKGNQHSSKYWYPNMKKSEIDLVKRIAKREINTTDNYIDNENKWLYNKFGDKTYFALYSTAHTDEPTILYACKNDKAEFEYRYFTEKYLKEDDIDGSIHKRTKAAGEIFGNNESKQGGKALDNGDALGRGINSGDAGLYSKNTRRRPSEALLNCLRNFKKTQSDDREVLGGRVESNSDDNSSSGQYSLGSPIQKLKYGEKGNQHSPKYWYSNMKKSEIDLVKRIAKREINTTDNYIDNENKWLYNKFGDKTYFALYSIAHTDDPTVLYACKGERAEFEYWYFLNNWFRKEEQENVYEKSGIVERLSKSGRNSSNDGIVDIGNTLGRGSNTRDVGLYSKNTRRRPSEALLNCLRNFEKIQGHVRKVLGGRVESNSDTDSSSGQYSLASPIQKLKYGDEFELSQPDIDNIEISDEVEFLVGLNDSELSKTQKHIIDICRTLDSELTVEFVDNLKTNGKFIRSQNKILIKSNLNAVQMYIEVFKHEFMHRLEMKMLYSNFFNFCFKKSVAFEQYVRTELKSAGVDYNVDAAPRDSVLEAYTKYKFNEYKNDNDIPQQDRDAFTMENAREEIIADFFAQILFQGKKYRARIIEALENADGEALIGIGDEVSSEAALMELQQKEPTLFEQVVQWFRDIINRLRGLPQAKSLAEQLDNEINQLESMVRRVYQSGDSERLIMKKFGEVRYSTEKSFAEQVEDVINGVHNPRYDLYISETPKYLIDLNFIEGPLLMRNSKISEILEKHSEISKDTIKFLPEAMEEPILILKSKTHPTDSVVVITDIMTDKGEMIVPVWVNQEGSYIDIELGQINMNTNFIASSYGRDIKKLLEYANDNNGFLYQNPNMERVRKLLARNGLQLPTPLKLSDSDIIVPQMIQSVNMNSMQETDKYSSMQKKYDEIKFSLMNDNTFESNVDNIVTMNDIDALLNKEEGNFVRVMYGIPAIVRDNVADAENLDVIISFYSLYLAIRKNGVLEGHYHNLGSEIIKKLPKYINNPDAIVRTNNGRLNLFAQIETPKGNNGILSIELNTVKDINNHYDKYNLVVTVFSAGDNYTRNNIIKNVIKVEYKKENLLQVNPQLYEWLTIVNNKLSLNNINEKELVVNIKDSKRLMKKKLADGNENKHLINEQNPKNNTSGYEKFDKPITVDDVAVLRSIGKKSINDFSSEDIEKAQKWAYKFYRELGVKSPFFRAWFGDWRAYDIKNKIKVINNSTAKEFKAGKAKNIDTGRYISWGDQIKGETKIKYGTTSDVFIFLKNIEEIVNNSIFLDTNVSILSSKHKMHNTAFMHSLYSIIEDGDGNLCLIKLLVEEAFNDKMTTDFSIAYELQEIKKVVTLYAGVHSKNGGLTRQVTTDYSISNLFELVKKYDKNFKPISVNKEMLNSDGTPKLLFHQTKGDFNEFDTADASDNETPNGVFLKESDRDIGLKGKKQMALYARMINPLVVQDRAQLVQKTKELSSEYAELYDKSKEIDKEYSKKYEAAIKAFKDFIIRNSESENRKTREELYKDPEFLKVWEAEDNIVDEWQRVNRENDAKAKEALTKALKDNEYDGVILKSDAGSFGRSTEAYIVLDNTQVKSATDNIGAFDGENSNIQYSLGSPLQQIKYGEKGNQHSSKYWYPNMKKSEIDLVKRIAKREINTTDNYIDNENKWLYNKFGDKTYFALYSTAHTDEPTILYACKGEKAEFEYEFLIKYLEKRVDDNGNIHTKSRTIDTISVGDKNTTGTRDGYSVRPLGRGSDTGDVGLYSKNTRRRPSEALRNCLQNIREIRDRDRKGLGRRVESNSDDNLSSGQYSLGSPLQKLKYSDEFELSQPDIDNVEISDEVEFLVGLNNSKLSKAQKHIADIAYKLNPNLKVEFVDGLETKGKFIRSQNIILIRSDLNAVQMYVEVFKHEFMHGLETKALYSKFFNFCFKKSKAFEQYVRAELKSAGMDYDVDTVTREGVLDAYTKYKYDQYKNSRDISKADRDAFTVENAQQEIIADFFAEVLFQGEKYRSKLISALESADGEALIGIGDEISSEAVLLELQQNEPDLLEQVKQWLRDIINKLRGMPQAKSVVLDLENELDYLESMVRRVYQSKDSKRLVRKKMEETKFKIMSFNDGTKYVDIITDQDRFNRLTIDEMRREAKKVIKENFVGKVIGTSNRVFVNSRSAAEYSYPSKFIKYDDITEAKMRASTELDNLVEIGSNYRNEPDGLYGHTHKKAKGGFDYYDIIFKVGKRYYFGTINIMVTDRGKLLKDITKIRDISNDIITQYGKNPQGEFVENISKNIIFNFDENVNVEKINDNSNSSPSGQYSLGSSIQHMRYNLENSVVEKLTETQYNNFGWVRYNNVLTALEYKILLSRYADYKHNKNQYPTTRFGEAVILSSECPDVLMYVKGSIDNPQITKIVRINKNDSTEFSIIREEILLNEYKQESFPFSFIERYYGQEVLIKSKARDYVDYREYERRLSERRDSQEIDTYSRTEQYGVGSIREDTTVGRADSVDESAFLIPIAKRNNDIKQITEEQCNYIENITNILGIRVVFEDLRDLYYKGEIISPDGYIENGVIHINLYAQNPIGFVFKHELTHFGERSAKYQEFVKQVKKSGKYKEWLVEKTAESDHKIAEYRYKQKLILSHKDIQTVNDPKADAEMIADFVGDMLFTENGSGMAALTSELEIKQRNIVVQFVLDFISFIKKKLSGLRFINLQLSVLEDSFNRMISDATNLAQHNNDITDGANDRQFCFVRCTDENVISAAEEMEKSGTKQLDIWQELKVIRDAWGNWLREVNTRNFSFYCLGNALTEHQQPNPKINFDADIIRGKLEDFIRLKDLFTVYPQLRKVNVEIRYAKTKYDTAKYLPDGNKLIIDKKLYDDYVENNDHKIKAHIIREIQRMVQMIEGRNIDYRLKNIDKLRQYGDLPMSLTEDRYLTEDEIRKNFADDYEAREAEKRQRLRNDIRNNFRKNINYLDNVVVYAPYFNYDEMLVVDDDFKLVSAKQYDKSHENHKLDNYPSLEYGSKTDVATIIDMENNIEPYQIDAEIEEKLQKDMAQKNSESMLYYLNNKLYESRVRRLQPDKHIRAGHSGDFEYSGETAEEVYSSLVEGLYKRGLIEASGYDTVGRILERVLYRSFDDSEFKDKYGNILSFYMWKPRQKNIEKSIKSGYEFATFDDVVEEFYEKKKKRPMGHYGVFEEFYINAKNPLKIRANSWNTIEIAKHLLSEGKITVKYYNDLMGMKMINQPTYDNSAAKNLRERMKLLGYDSIVFIKDSGRCSVSVFDADQIVSVAKSGILTVNNGITQTDEVDTKEQDVCDVNFVVIDHKGEYKIPIDKFKNELSKCNSNTDKLKKLTELLMCTNQPKLLEDSNILVGSSGIMENTNGSNLDVYAKYKLLKSRADIPIAEFDIAGRAVDEDTRQKNNGTILKDNDGKLLSLFAFRSYTNNRSIHGAFGMRLGTLGWAHNQYLVEKEKYPNMLKYQYEEYYANIQNSYYLRSSSETLTPENIAKNLFKDGKITFEEYDRALNLEGADSASTHSKSAVFVRRIMLRNGFDSITYMDKLLDKGSMAIIVLDDSRLTLVSVNGQAVDNNMKTQAISNDDSAFYIPQNFHRKKRKNKIDIDEKISYNNENGLTQSEKLKLKQKTGWSDEIINHIHSMDEAEIYINANLIEAEINGRKCLIRSDIDMDQIDKNGLTNFERMKAGKAPYTIDGEKVELHHIGQKDNSPLAELTHSEHHSNGNYKILHQKLTQSEVNRTKFNSKRMQHWKIRRTKKE